MRPTQPVGGRPGTEVLVGRDRELAELRAGLEEAFRGRGRLALLVGEPGIGKTRLADELAAHAADLGARVVFGRCYEAEGAPPYWPWIQIIRTYARSVEPEELRPQLGPGAPDVAGIVPEVQELLPDLPDVPARDPEQA